MPNRCVSGAQMRAARVVSALSLQLAKKTARHSMTGRRDDRDEAFGGSHPGRFPRTSSCAEFSGLVLPRPVFSSRGLLADAASRPWSQVFPSSEPQTPPALQESGMLVGPGGPRHATCLRRVQPSRRHLAESAECNGSRSYPSAGPASCQPEPYRRDQLAAQRLIVVGRGQHAPRAGDTAGCCKNVWHRA